MVRSARRVETAHGRTDSETGSCASDSGMIVSISAGFRSDIRYLGITVERTGWSELSLATRRTNDSNLGLGRAPRRTANSERRR